MSAGHEATLLAGWLNLAQGFGLPSKSQGTFLLQSLLGEAQLARQVGYVADGEA